jgi:hypothetical protein
MDVDTGPTQEKRKENDWIPVTNHKKKNKQDDKNSNATITEFTQAVRIRIPMKPKETTFQPMPTARKVFELLFNAEPNLSLHGKGKTINNMESFPTTEEDFNAAFEIYDEKQIGDRPRHVLTCRIDSPKAIKLIKFESDALMKWLKENQVVLEVTEFGTEKIGFVGYLFNIHPRITFRDQLNDGLSIDLHAMPKNNDEILTYDPTQIEDYRRATANGDDFHMQIPPFDTVPVRLGHGQGRARIITEALAIKAKASNVPLLRKLFAQAADQEKFKDTDIKYIPLGLAQTIGNDNYAKLLSEQNQMLLNTATIPLSNFPPNIWNIQLKDKIPTVEEWTLAQPWCHAIEPTHTPGKYLLLTTKQQLNNARIWTDHELIPTVTNLMQANKDAFPGPYPERTDKKQMCDSECSYVNKLRQSINNPQSGEPAMYHFPKRPPTKSLPKKIIYQTSTSAPSNPMTYASAASTTPMTHTMPSTEGRPTSVRHHPVTPTSLLTNPQALNLKEMHATLMRALETDLDQRIQRIIGQTVTESVRQQTQPINEALHRLQNELSSVQQQTQPINAAIITMQNDLLTLKSMLVPIFDRLQLPVTTMEHSDIPLHQEGNMDQS